MGYSRPPDLTATGVTLDDEVGLHEVQSRIAPAPPLLSSPLLLLPRGAASPLATVAVTGVNVI